MKAEGLPWAALSRRCGFASDYLRVQVCGGCRCHLTRWKVEAALGYRFALWSDAATLARRKRSLDVFGLDPLLATRSELRRAADKHGFDFSLCYAKHDYVDRVFARLAAVGTCAAVGRYKRDNERSRTE